MLLFPTLAPQEERHPILGGGVHHVLVGTMPVTLYRRCMVACLLPSGQVPSSSDEVSFCTVQLSEVML